MDTLRAAAYLANGGWLLFVLILLWQNFPEDESKVITAILAVAAPVLSIITIAKLSGHSGK